MKSERTVLAEYRGFTITDRIHPDTGVRILLRGSLMDFARSIEEAKSWCDNYIMEVDGE